MALLVFWQDLISLWRDMLVVKATPKAAAYLDLTDSEEGQLRAAAEAFRRETLLYHCRLLEDALFAMQKANAVKRVVAELTLTRMCDESMDTSNEALLSRLAKLEDRVALGVPVSAATSPKPEDTGKAEPPAERAAKPQEKPVGADAPQEGKRILRPFRAWTELISRVGQNDPMLSSFCRGAEAYTTEDGGIVVRFPSDFAKGMIEKGGGRAKLRAALISTAGADIADDRLIFEVSGKTEHSALDEIIAAAEDE